MQMYIQSKGIKTRVCLQSAVEEVLDKVKDHKTYHMSPGWNTNFSKRLKQADGLL